MIRKLIPQKVINLGKHLPEAILANFRYGFPGRKIKVIGVSGTDGKTTTVNMIYQILKDAGKKVSMISTINATIAGISFDTGFHVTTPDRFQVQKFLSQSVKNGDEYMILEITSQGLDQYRAWGIPIDVGVITNITHEHLDYHKNFENYRMAKARLIQAARVAILNHDDPSFSILKKLAGKKAKVVSFGLDDTSDVNPKQFPIMLRLPGQYNLYNALAAAAVADNYGIDDKVILDSLKSFNSLSGRMEKIENNKGINIVIDFAHTPNALENVLQALRSETKGNLIAVFGAASKRDETKRPVMGQLAAKLADIVILTDEDPRFENGLDIIEQIQRGAIAAGAKLNQSLFVQPDRQKAINQAINLAKKGDTVGIFGKGHERSMSYQGKEIPWSDQEAVEKALKK